MDDGSTDSPREVVNSFDDKRIRYVWQENKGLAGARNTGIRMAEGEYVAFLDADDSFLPHKLETQAKFLDERAEIGLVASGWVETDQRGKHLRSVEPWTRKPSLTLAQCVMGVPVVSSAVLVRRQWLDAVGLFDEDLLWREDWDLWLRLAAEGCLLIWMPDLVSYYRIGSESMAHNAPRMRMGAVGALDKLYARPNLPEPIREMKDAAYSKVYVSSASRAYGARDWSEAKLDLAEATRLNPNLLLGDPCQLVQELIGWMSNPIVGGEDEYLFALTKHLPSLYPETKGQIRKAVARRCMGQVYEAHRRGEWGKVRANLLKSLRLDPTWIVNRGVVSIAARIFLPSLR